jgi:Ca2+-transporting ATPase
MAMGLPTEAAIKVMVEKLGRYDEDYNYMESKSYNQYNDHIRSKQTVLQMLEFSRERKAMSVLCTDG